MLISMLGAGSQSSPQNKAWLSEVRKQSPLVCLNFFPIWMRYGLSLGDSKKSYNYLYIAK